MIPKGSVLIPTVIGAGHTGVIEFIELDEEVPASIPIGFLSAIQAKIDTVEQQMTVFGEEESKLQLTTYKPVGHQSPVLGLEIFKVSALFEVSAQTIEAYPELALAPWCLDLRQQYIMSAWEITSLHVMFLFIVSVLNFIARSLRRVITSIRSPTKFRVRICYSAYMYMCVCGGWGE